MDIFYHKICSISSDFIVDKCEFMWYNVYHSTKLNILVIIRRSVMKYCTHCGAQLEDDAVVCVSCGRMVGDPVKFNQSAAEPAGPSAISTVAFVFMIIGTVAMAISTCCIGLAWCLPMTISYSKSRKNGTPVSTGFKVCSLLFVNTVAGILMLCDNQ